MVTKWLGVFVIIDINAIYTIWLREMTRFFRLKSRVVGSMGMPLFFLAFMGMGFNTSFGMSGAFEGVDYITYLTPGIIGMTLLFSSMFVGLSVLWDREFGFLKEIMVIPVSRVSIVLGRTLGGVTTGLLQGMIIMVLGIPLGFKMTGISSEFSVFSFSVGLLLSIVFMCLIAATFIGLGLAFASKMEDMSGYSLIMNFLIFPLFFLSGALFPVENLPKWVQSISYLDPLTYGVDGLKGCLIGGSQFPLIVDFVALFISCIVMICIGTYLFEKTEVN